MTTAAGFLINPELPYSASKGAISAHGDGAKGNITGVHRVWSNDGGRSGPLNISEVQKSFRKGGEFSHVIGSALCT